MLFKDGIVRCLDPECGKITCRWCMQPEHGPLKCDEVEKVSWLRYFSTHGQPFVGSLLTAG